jgi:hypothetical protein
MDRIQWIGLVNPEWAQKISLFLDLFPEFNKYRQIASLTSKSIPTDEWWMPKTLFEFCIYYPCSAGVRYTYAVEQFKVICAFLRSECTGPDDWNVISEKWNQFIASTPTIQPKKRQIYLDIIEWMKQHDINRNEITIAQVEQMQLEVKGLGVSFINAIREQYSTSDAVCQYTDIGYIKAYRTVYGTTSNIKQQSEQWMSMGFGRVATSFMFQIYHYGHLT